MERYSSSPQRAVAPTEEEEECLINSSNSSFVLMKVHTRYDVCSFIIRGLSYGRRYFTPFLFCKELENFGRLR